MTAGGVEEAAPTKRSTLGFTMSSLAGFVVIRMAVLADSVAALAVAAEPTELSKEATKEQTFLRWLEREGADVSKVVWPVRDAHGGRKAMAAVDVAADAAALAVPKALLMTPSAAEAMWPCRMVACRSCTCTGLSAAEQPNSSAAPYVNPGLTPPPAIQTVNP